MELATVDLLTGEILESPISPQKKMHLPAFVMLCKTVMLAASQDPDLRLESFRILAYMISKTGAMNRCAVASQEELCTALNMKQPNASRGMKKLLDKRLLIRGAKIGKGYAYQLNPRVGYYGEGSSWMKDMVLAPHLSLAEHTM